MADHVQAYSQSPMPRATSKDENNRERRLIDHRQPHRATTSPFPSTMSPQVNPYLGQTAYPPPQLYSGQRNSQTTPMSDTYFPQKNYTYSDLLYPLDEPIPGPSQLYPAHEQHLYGVSYYNHRKMQMPTPEPFVPVPPKPLALQETRGNGGHAILHPTLYRSMTSPPVPPKPVLFSESEPGPGVIPTGAYPGNFWPGTISTSTADEIPRPPGAVATNPPVAEESADQQLQEEEDGGDDLAVAMALSKDESEREEERMQELVRLEEEELERALAASMLTANGRYDDFESQLGADRSNLASSATQSFLFAIPPDVHLEAGPSATSSSFLETPAKDASSRARKIDELGHEDSALQVHEGTKRTLETVKASPQQTTERCPPDVSSCPRMSSDDDQVEIYPPAAGGPPSAAPPFPPMIQPQSVIGTNDDDDGLPYLKGARETLSVSIPLLTEPDRESRLSPVSASFIDLSYDDSYIDEDEAFARRLEEEEKSSRRLLGGETPVQHQSDHLTGEEPPECNLSRNSSATSASTRPRPETPNDLPTYSDVISGNSGLALQGSTYLPSVTIESLTSPEKAEQMQNSSMTDIPIARSTSQLVVPFPSHGLSAIALPPDGPQRARVSSSSALTPGRTPTENEVPFSPVDDLATPKNHLSLGLGASYPPTTSMKGFNSSSDNPSCAGVFNPNLFIDAELFLGVSMQFTPPVISARLVPMQGQMPTLISLPYGRCPPLHFQALSWRHILKLMARLSSTKMEPSIEAMAVNKNEALKLRTVIQFIKLHHMSDEWRTILWFTIDHPVPLNMPNAAKHSSTNVNNLPFSYTLSSIPALLKDASDTSLSKTYTIPATGSVPYPSLPITFPNLALYLQAALDESRKQSESSPLRKLAKMVQTCYPNDFVPQESDEPENSRGVSGLFKRVMGRGGKKKGGGGNEDTYDLVTPFVPDEWG